jgi:alkyldihydroxyacetonephosphate synthase
MRRWNGWGDEATYLDLPETGESFLNDKVGQASPLKNATYEEVAAKVPESRLSEHALYSIDVKDRISHARGQSLPDWLAMKSGDVGTFPDAVAYPESTEDVRELMDLAKAQNWVVIPYGGGTSVVGHINPKQGDRPVVTIDMSKMCRLLDLDEQSHIATFGAGVPGPLLESQLLARGYTLGHFPQSFELSTLGGWVASRSSGQQSLKYGRIEQMFAGGRIESIDKTLEIPTFPASSAGPDLREWFMGSEGRFGIITEVKVRVTPVSQKESFYVAFLPDWHQALNCVRNLVQAGIPMSMMRLSNPVETETQLALAGHEKQINLLEKALKFKGAGEGKCMMTFGLTHTKAQNNLSLKEVKRIISQHKGVYTGTYLGKKWKEKRFLFPYLRETLWERGYAVDTLETATDWDNVDDLMQSIERNLATVLAEQGLQEKVHVFTHLSHFYSQGCSIYTTYVFRTGDSYEETLERWKALKHTTSDIIVKQRGTISHQHGVGEDHAPYMAIEKGDVAIGAIRKVADYFDPDEQLNPGKLFK